MMKRAAKKILEAIGFELRRVNYKFEPKKKGSFTGEFAAEIHAILPEATIIIRLNRYERSTISSSRG